MLKTGVAYHGNRLLRHVEEDMLDCLKNNFNLVVHMFTHNDWQKSGAVMKDIIALTESLGLEVWLDCWSLVFPGEMSDFLSANPECRQIYSSGEPVHDRVCFNSNKLFKFINEWLDAAKECGGKNIFWDEPYLLGEDLTTGKILDKWTCRCETCRELFKAQYGIDMPKAHTPEIREFRLNSLLNYFRIATAEARKKGLKNTICLRPYPAAGIEKSLLQKFAAIDTIDSLGTDPYKIHDPYAEVHEITSKCLDVCKEFNKDHNIWIQGYGYPRGTEENIIQSVDAAYDAGAKTILTWSYRGGESHNFRAECADMTWKTLGDAMGRIKNRERDLMRLKKRKSLKLTGN